MANYKLKSKGKWGEENKGICGFDCGSLDVDQGGGAIAQ